MTNEQIASKIINLENVNAELRADNSRLSASLERLVDKILVEDAKRANKEPLTLGQLANRIIDLEDALGGMLSLALERIGPDAEKCEAFITARHVLTQKVNHG
jgi:hypothetical protein